MSSACTDSLLVMNSSTSILDHYATSHLHVSEVALANLSLTMAATEEQLAEALAYDASYLKVNMINVSLLTMFCGMCVDACLVYAIDQYCLAQACSLF